MNAAEFAALVVLHRPRWWDLAACRGRGPDEWFVERGGRVPEQRAMCALCPVRLNCLDHAIRRGEKFGIWGGLTQRERRPLRRAYLDARHRHPSFRQPIPPVAC